MIDWDPQQYARFQEQRERPAFDLLTQTLTEFTATDAWDLGCGDGQWATLISNRYPKAQVRGLDSSEAMLSEARLRSDCVQWIQGDIADWRTKTPPDLIFSNAALHLVPDHAALFPRLAGSLRDGGRLAVQMPVADGSGWRAVLAEVLAEEPWASRLAGVEPTRTHGAEAYYDWLQPHCASIDIWTTTYLHILEGPSPVLEWIKGAALRRYFAALSTDAERGALADALRTRLDALHPRRADGTTLFPFPRMFLLASR